MRGVVLIIWMVLLINCTGGQPCRTSTDPVAVELNVHRIDQKLFQSTSPEEIEAIFNEHRDYANLFLDANQYPSDLILANRMFELIQNPSIDTLFQESQDAFRDISELIASIETSVGRLKTYYPEVGNPTVYTSVTGLYKDLFISNDFIMIGMDFFIGRDATYKPKQIPEYILRRYTVDHLPATVMQFISSQFISQCDGESMLSEMIDYGKSYYLLSKILPCTPEYILMGYTPEEWAESFENDKIIWANFIENSLLYETNYQIKQKFLGERPNVYEIGDKCPGRIGRWLGWQMVKSYAEQSGITVQRLMSETNANKIFNESGYKPSGG